MAEFTPTPERELDNSSLSGSDNVMETTETNNDRPEDGEDSSPGKGSRKHASPSDDDVSMDDNDAGGLFGSGSEDEGGQSPRNKRRKLDDKDLDSGDDEGRRDRMDDGSDQQDVEKELSVMNVSLGRHAIPKGTDGELYLLKNPTFVGFEQKAFTQRSFLPPTTDHHSSLKSSTFSPSQTANTTVRWRRDPQNTHKLQSNSRIIRWSDGSLTMQIGSSPMVQHELPGKPLAPPQRNPVKPTPTSITGTKIQPTVYDSRLDSHTYLASVYPEIEIIQVTNHITTSLTVQSTTEDNDDALVRLQEAMNAAIKSNKGETGTGPGVISIKEDPELAKRKAEIAEKEKARAEKRRQNQIERERDRAGRVLGRSGLRNTMAGGLSVGALEDEDGMTTTRARPKPSRRPRRRNSEYSDDEDDYQKGRTREDEYDEDDGFLVGSDEEPEVVPDDSEEEAEFGEDDDAIGEEDGEGDERTKKKKKEKRRSGEEARGAGGAGRGRRNVVDDDDEEEAEKDE